MSDELFSAIVERGDVREATNDEAWLAAMLRAESALAGALADAGLVPMAVADEIARACEDPDRFDLGDLARDTALGGNPVIPLVAALRGAVSSESASWVHHGATSQDILDTALMLLARHSLAIIRTDLEQAQAALIDLVAAHGEAAMIGRTLMQAARPITFGAKAATWARGFDQVDERLARVATSLPVQLGGPVGMLTDYGQQADAVVTAYADALGLVAAPSWHTVRIPIADLASVLATTAGVVDKLARDVVLMAQTEVGEVREVAPGRGGSSSMDHKHNPIAAISASASARRAAALAGHLHAQMAHEHERAAGAWHAEWVPLVDLLRTTGSAAAWLGDCLAHLAVDEDALAANLRADGR